MKQACCTCLQLNYHCIIHNLKYHISEVLACKECWAWFSACWPGCKGTFDTHTLVDKGLNVDIKQSLFLSSFDFHLRILILVILSNINTVNNICLPNKYAYFVNTYLKFYQITDLILFQGERICRHKENLHHWVSMTSHTHTHVALVKSWQSYDGYRRKKWIWQHGFTSWTRLIALHTAIMPSGKLWIQFFFFFHQWVNNWADWVL